MKKAITIASLTFASLVLFQCGPESKRKAEDGQNTVKSDLRKEKDEFTRNLKELRNEIDERFDAVRKKMREDKHQSKKGLDSLEKRLETQQKRVDQSLQDVENSTEGMWLNTKEKVNQAMTDIKIELDKIVSKIEAAFGQDKK